MKNKVTERKIIKVKFKGKIVQCVSIGDLATSCGYATISIKKMEENGVIPKPNIRGKAFSNGEPGKRLYTITLVDALKIALSKVKNGVKISDEIKREIAIAFINEKEYLNTEI